MSRAPRVTEDGRRWTATGDDYEVRVDRVEANEVVVIGCRADPGADLADVARTLTALVPLATGTIISWVRPDLAALHDALEAAGCVVHRRKAFVERDLTGDLPDAGAFTWRTLPEVGQPTFLRLMTEVSEGDPFEEGERDPEREWAELVEYAGEAHDFARWRVAIVDDEPIGVVLPTAWPKRSVGTLAYLGVRPAHRGRGLGRALHAAGLHVLASIPVETYKGSTDVRNEAMIRVFEANGCTRKADQLILKRTAPSP